MMNRARHPRFPRLTFNERSRTHVPIVNLAIPSEKRQGRGSYPQLTIYVLRQCDSPISTRFRPIYVRSINLHRKPRPSPICSTVPRFRAARSTVRS
jgi:hypothetical protein